MLRIKFATFLLLTSLVTAGVSAEYIDFTSTAFSDAYGDGSYSFTAADGTTVTLTAGGSGSALYWDTEDGFGVMGSSGYEKDEIDSREYLTLNFSQSTYLDDVFVTDLFKESGYLEIGYYTLDNGSTTKFLADATQVTGTNGEKTLDLNQYVKSITFSAPGKLFLQNHEFSIGGITIGARVPELDPGPAGSALALLIAGGLALYGRRRAVAAR